ncbi:MAG TPA: exosortase/archaeosortase family protein [Luteolibacter sp.]
MSEHEQIGDSADLQANHETALDCGTMGNRRLWIALSSLGLVCLLFIPVLHSWFRIAMSSDLHSHVVLIPLVSAYLLVIDRKTLAWDSKPSPVTGIGILVLSGMVAGWAMLSNPPWSAVDLIALQMLAFVVALWGVGMLGAGSRWMRSAMFPMGFLLFMVPLPDLAVSHLEQFLMVMSARLAEMLFPLGSIPVFKNGQVLELPGMTLEVASECSGIRSSWVLFTTSVLAAYLFLPSLPRRLVLVAAVLPLGILRNAVRIYVIGWLCVNYGPEMIDSWIHRKGGPVFFAASLVPLFLMTWWLRKRRSGPEILRVKKDSDSPENNRQCASDRLK